jgi:hypothetical protein
MNADSATWDVAIPGNPETVNDVSLDNGTGINANDLITNVKANLSNLSPF